ncbi:MAG: LPXTG cell wall anchor domain-containing protein, partial [Clostridiales bacterium]|nr:LPXTG cell wall anchor domain-containing protein [Clostridiales bacterium]
LDGTIIYSKDQLVETLNCGNISSATTKELPLGAFYVKEKVPPVGYNLDTSRHDVNIEYQGQNVAVVRKNADVKNNVVEGWISVTKHTDLPDPDVTPQNPQIEEPLDNINFQVYLKSAGSYDAALPTERDIMTTNENGYAITKSLPYGLYVVKELPDTKGRDIKIVDPFEVFISAEGMTYRYILNDPTFKSLVKVTKVDSETGKTIPVAGVSFKVKDLSNSQWVTQHINYPTPVDIDVFQTSPDGSLVMPKVLKAGKYELYEQSAPWGYILNSKPVPFTINSDQADPAIAEVIMANAPAMGVISVDKKGDNLTGVTVADTSFGKQYTPVFGQVVLKGAIFEVRAAEDIYTPDGTLRYSKNTLVDTITTDSNGFAKTKQLYLGNYILTEVKAPENFVLDKTPHNVSLVYAGQSVPVVSAQSSIGNARQQVDIELQKLMEKPIDAVKDFNPFQDVIFGLFSDEDIKADNGSVAIPKGSLVALMRIDDNGKGVIKGELPFVHYYIKEVQTNNFYQLNSTKYPVSAVYQGQDKAKATIQVNNNGIAIPNEAKQGQITITKTGEMLVGATVFSNKDHSIYTPVYEIRNLPGATFNIIATEDVYNVYGTLIIPKGTIVDTVTTDSSGKAVSKLLHIGQYEIIETKAPDGTVLDKTPHPVTLGFDGEVSDIISKSVSIYNDRQKAEINLTKECESPSISDGSEMLPKDYNPYDGVTFALYASKDIKTADGTTAIPANSLLELVTFDENGKAVVKTDLPYGSFYLKEVKAADGYVLDSTKYNFNFDYDALGGKTVTINVNNGDPVNNNLQRGGLKLIKTFEGKTYPIANIPFHVVGHTYIGTTVEKDVVTDKNGEVNLEGLLAGNWTVTELGSDLSAGYVLSPTQAFTIANGKITELALENKLMRGDLTITKTFEGIRTPLKDIPFHIVGKTTAGIDYDETLKTDENGQIVLKGLLIGEYKIQELSCDLSTHFVLSEEQTAVVAQDKLTEMKIENNLIRGNVKLIKIACGTGDRLAGAEFQLFDQSGTSLGIYTTDENGEININNLVYGLGYKFVETKAPDGYKGKAVFTFDITENEKTIILSATNVPECTCPPSQDTCIPPKTGDEGIPIWVYTGLILSSGTLFGLMLFKRRKHA